MADNSVLSFVAGRDKIIETASSSKDRFVFIGIYGWSDNGKSYLIDEVGQRLEKKGLSTACYTSAPSHYLFDAIKDSIPSLIKRVHLFHCAWERSFLRDRELLFPEQDPGFLSEKILGKSLDLVVGIYNPNFYGYIRGEYDFVISNSDSKEKPPLR